MSYPEPPNEGRHWNTEGLQRSPNGQWQPTAPAADGLPPGTNQTWPARIYDHAPAPDQNYGYQPYELRSPSQSITVYAADSSNNTSLAPVTSLVCGLIGFFIAWIPFVGIAAWIFGPLAVVFGLLGLRRGKAEHKIMSLIGTIAGVIALAWCFGYLTFFLASLAKR